MNKEKYSKIIAFAKTAPVIVFLSVTICVNVPVRQKLCCFYFTENK